MKNTFEIEGKLLRVDPYVSPKGKSFPTAVIEIPDDKFPGVAGVKFFGRTGETVSVLVPGSIVRITGTLGGREWNGKVYTEAKGLSVEVVKEAERQVELPETIPDSDCPF